MYARRDAKNVASHISFHMRYKMSRETDLLQTDSDGLLLVGLPRVSELIVQILSRKTGHNAAEVIGAALEYLAAKILSDDEKAQVVKILKDHTNPRN